MMRRKIVTILLIFIIPFASAGFSATKYPCACCFPKQSPVDSFLSMFSETGMKCCHERFRTEAKTPPCCLNRALEDEKPFLMKTPIGVSFAHFLGFAVAYIVISPDHENPIMDRKAFLLKRSKNIYIQNLTLRC